MRRFRVVLGNGNSVKTGKARRIDPRRKSTTAAALCAKAEKGRSLMTAKTELRVVPGVGPVNEQLLCNKGIVSVAELISVFHDLCEQEDTKLVDYLHEEVGIRHRHHCKSIAGYLKQTPAGIAKEPQPRITLSIEGNISAGKTTFLEMVRDAQLEKEGLCEVVPEPVDTWQRVGGNAENNLLKRFYDNPSKYAYEFQNYVFLTRLEVNRRTFDGRAPLRLMERSVFSDRLVFVRAVHESKWMDDFQLDLYDSWFHPMLREVPGLIPDGFIYLRADPDTCMKRLKRRNRSEEGGVSDEYLQGLHQKHEEWFKREPQLIGLTPRLYKSERGVLQLAPCELQKVGSGLDTLGIPDELRGSIIWLGENEILSNDPTHQNGHELKQQNGTDLAQQNGSSRRNYVSLDVKTAMSRIPALVLDCNDDIDVKNNVEAKADYARKVKMYYDFVSRYTQSQKQIRHFWNAQSGEILRQKWQLVDSMSYEYIRQLSLELSERQPNNQFTPEKLEQLA